MSPQGQTIVVTSRFFDAGTRRYLEDHGYRVLEPDLDAGPGEAHFDPAHLLAIAGEADGWLLGQSRVTAEVLAGLPKLKVIARRGVGYERVDVAAARAHGITVTIGTGGNDASTADHALALMLSVARRLRESQERMLAGNWGILVGGELYGKTVGVIGLGRVGRGVIQRLAGFSCQIVVATPRPDPDLQARFGLRYATLPELFSQCDFISLHLPLTDETKGIVDAAALACMKPTAILINTARGGLIDEPALLAALQAGRIGGAGLDVFLAETEPAARPVADALLALPNVVGTPHAAGSTREALMRTNMIAARTLVAALSGRAPAPETVIVAGGGRTPD